MFLKKQYFLQKKLYLRNINFELMRNILFRYFLALFFILFVSLNSLAENPKNEIRAIWLTTNYGLDWPNKPATDLKGAEKQKADLCKILDMVVELNMNTVFFQARLRSDVLYNSEIEPYNAVMTGTRGKKPLYDPLAFAIEECHKRGLQCHAWVVCMNVGSDKAIKMQGNKALPKVRPEICTKYNGEWYLNPGEPETAFYLIDIVSEIVKKYSIDGIHLDYIRYPDRAHDFPDSKSYKKYALKGESLKEWRIKNINNIVYSIYDVVKKINPKVMVSSAVLGKRDNHRYYSSMGWSGMEATYQDVAAWLKAGKQDFVAPMMYYPDKSFYPFVKDWVRNSNGYPIVAGLGVYRLAKSDGNWSLRDFMPQIYISREMGIAGSSFYRTKQLEENLKEVATVLKTETYSTPALFPPLKNYKKGCDVTPYNLEIDYAKDGSKTISWDCDGEAKYYTIYASKTYPVDTRLAENIIEARYLKNSFKHNEKNLYYAVTATNDYYYESDAVQQSQPPLYFFEGEKIVFPTDRVNLCKSVSIISPTSDCVYYREGREVGNIPSLKKGIYSLKITYSDFVAIYPLIIN